MDALKEILARNAVENLSEAERADLESTDEKKAEAELPARLREEPKKDPARLLVQEGAQDEKTTSDIRVLLAEMTMAQKIKAAFFGNSVCRGLLILDPSRIIQQCVLKNPKLTANEVESYCKNPNMADTVLRAIGDSREWTKTYSIKYYLVVNPKTPGDVSLKWMRHLNAPDLKKISKSKNVPQLIAVTAKKRVAEMEKK